MRGLYIKFKDRYRNDYYYLIEKIRLIYNYLLYTLLKIILSPLMLMLFPLYKYLYKNKIFFLADIGNGVGHLVPEFDFYYLKYNNFRKVIFVNNGHKNYDLISSNYNFYKIFSGKYYFFIILFLSFYPRLNLVVSQTMPDEKFLINLFSNRYNRNYYFKYYNRYLQLRKKKKSFFKIYAENKKLNNNYLNLKKKIACIHFRENISTAVSQLSNPNNYIKSIKLLINLDYEIYFVGREKLPESFRKLGVINYAAFSNIDLDSDINLFYASDISIICGSGISYIPDALDKKYLYINSWHISRPGGVGNYSIFVPSLIKNNETKKLLNFSNQAKIENTGKHYHAQYLDKSQYTMIHPTEEEIYQGLSELLQFEEKKSPEQTAFKNIIRDYGWDRSSNSKISNFFLKKYKYLIK